MRGLFWLLALALAGERSAIQAVPLYRAPTVHRQLVTSSFLNGCKSSSADCVHMYAASGTRDTVTAEYRLPAGQGELEPMFEDLRRKEVGSALSSSFEAADFSCLFSRDSNNSVYIDGSFSFSGEVVAAITVFTARAGSELFVMSGSVASQTCAADSQRPLPIVLGNGLNDGAVAYARVWGAGRASACLKVVNGGSRNGEKFACVEPSNIDHRIEYYQDSACSALTVSMNASLPPSEVEQAESTGRPFVAFALLLGDSHQRQPFVSYADPIATPPRSNSDGGGADTTLARFFSGRTFIVLVYCLSALILMFVVTGIHSWNKLVDFGDVVLYRIPSTGGGEDKLGVAVAVLDCSHGLKYRNAGRSMMLQPLKHLAVPAPSDGVRSLRPADGAITEDALLQRMVASPSVRSVLSSGMSSAADLRILSNLGPPVAPAAGRPLRPTAVLGDVDMEPFPPLPTGPASSSTAVDWALRVERSFSDADHSAVSPLSRPTSPDQGAISFRGTELTHTAEPPLSAYKGEKNFFVFIEDETRSSLAFARKTFIMTMVDDIVVALYCLLVYPVLLLCSWLTPYFTPASDGRASDSVVPGVSDAGLLVTHTEPREPRRWSTMSLFGRTGPGCVQTDDIVTVLSTGQGDNFNDADIVKVNRRLFQQYLRFRRQNDLENDSISIEKLMSDRRMKGTGGSGGDLRALDGSSEDGDSPSGSAAGARRRGRRSGQLSPGGGPSYCSRRMPFRQMRAVADDDEECLPFIREVFDEMQEELDLEEELAHDVEMRRLDDARINSSRKGVDPASEYYIAVLTTATFSKVSA